MPKHRWPPFDREAKGTQRGVNDCYRVESRCSCGSGRVAMLIFPALCSVVCLDKADNSGVVIAAP